MLTQKEADGLLAVEKHRVDDKLWAYPAAGVEVKIPLVSVDTREEFLLDIRRHRIELVRGGKYQTRARVTSPIARVCFARAHRNPDGEEIPGTHLHVYREGYGLQWAYPLNQTVFPNAEDRWQLLEDFLRYSNVTRPPFMQLEAFA